MLMDSIADLMRRDWRLKIWTTGSRSASSDYPANMTACSKRSALCASHMPDSSLQRRWAQTAMYSCFSLICNTSTSPMFQQQQTCIVKRAVNQENVRILCTERSVPHLFRLTHRTWGVLSEICRITFNRRCATLLRSTAERINDAD